MKHDQNEDHYSLSPMQQGMLYHNLSGSRTGTDIEQIVANLFEPLDVSAFERAWQRIVARHAIFRTSFHWSGAAEPTQEVRAAAKTTFHSEDWSDLAAGDRDKAFATWLEADRLQGFDIARPPLARVVLFRFAEDNWRFVWTIHHLLLDARGMVLVLQEVFALYAAFQRGEDLELPAPQHYRQHIDWLKQQDRDVAEKHWRAALKGFSAATPLVVAHVTSGETHSIPAGVLEISLDSATTSGLNALAQAQDLTLNTIVQGAWTLLWHRYSGEADVVIGAVRAGRRSSIAGAESIVGLFINTVPVRTHYTPDALLIPWLTELRAQWVALRPFEHTALADIQSWSEVPNDQPLFETLFNFQPQPWDTALREMSPTASRTFSLRSQPNYPLTLDACGGETLHLKLIYDRRRFDEASITRMLGHLQTLLEAFARDPNQSLRELPLLTAPERDQLLTEWNRTDANFGPMKCVHEQVKEQAMRTPDALAIADEHTKLSYRELDQQSDELAMHLRARGIGPETCVAVCFERSVAMIVSWLAALKAGGAYLPLDPRTPKDRLAFMLQDVKAPLLLAGEKLISAWQLEVPGCEILTLDTVQTSTQTSAAAQNNCEASALAYVIFTSGSTGKPKAVAIEHRNLANLVAWHQTTYNIESADRATQLANPAFDASVWEVWPYLTAGASVHLPSEDTLHVPAKLAAWLGAEKITVTFIPTPMAEELFAETWPADVALRAMLTGGDALHAAPPEKFPCALLNHYGPTEYTVVATSDTIAPGSNDLPPIGRPISNTQVYVLDPQLQPVPIGVPGELHIGGAGLSRGYLNRPELTAEKFISHPFSQESGRLYKTGDLVRWREDGRLEFLGRIDRQIKLRGHRIEPGEIESWLLHHPAVREAAVVAGNDRLVAFVVPRVPVQSPQLREFLKQLLPDYMLPASFEFIDALPLTANGKVDRNSLSARTGVQGETEFVAPRNATEKTLAKIWCDVLGRDRLGVHDNFFHLGGHSLLAARVVSRAGDVLGREVPLQALFDSPTVAGLAQCLLTARAGKSSLVVRRARNGSLPLSFAQERLWFLEQLEPGVPFNNIPFAYQLEGPLNATALESALDEIIRRHEPLGTAIRNEQGRPQAVRGQVAPFALAREDFSGIPAPEREARAHQVLGEEARRPFDLTQTPLLRGRLIRLDERTHLLALVTHHIACDGWSMEVFHRELAQLYSAFARGLSPSIAELNISYADYADWQREVMAAESTERDLAWWKERLESLPPLNLPTDRPRGAVQTFRGATVPISLPAPLASQLSNLAQRENATLFMLLLAAFQTLLLRYTGLDDIAVGSPVAGRDRPEIENLVGMFLNTVVLRGKLSGNPSFKDLLKRTRQVVLDAFARRELPFERIADALQVGRDLSRPPLFQAMFVLQNEPRHPFELAGVRVRPQPIHSGTSKFDLSLSLEESPQGLTGYVEFNADLFDEATVMRMAGNYRALLEGVVAKPEATLSQLPILTDAERNTILTEWNETQIDFPSGKCIHELFADQVLRTPDAIALAVGDEELTYCELNARADALAAELRAMGVSSEVRVGICVERSLEMMVGLLGILKAGGCYVPLDPTYPQERLAFMLEDSGAAVLLTQEHLRDRFNTRVPALLIESARKQDGATIGDAAGVTSANLAYVIYTSGSTGKPKGVMLTHRNVVNFFTAMDRVLGTEPGVWLAVTSISFDISVLELFWTLTRGYKVVIHSDAERRAPVSRVTKAARKMDFSLFYFASDAGNGGADSYRLLTEGAKFADANGMTGIWTPERHFHQFGGLYPNAAVTSAALAMITRRVQLRAGSVVLPLHHPVRVAEDWAVIDNLSNGRAALSIASGWHANDFALAPQNYADRKKLMLENFGLIRRLWRGEVIELPNGLGEKIPVQLFPKPIQSDLPAWLTSSGSPETFQLAGELGLNLLTHLSGQGTEQLAKKIEIYRNAWQEHGHGPKPGCVSLMLHTFVWNDANAGRDIVSGPLREYLRTYRGLSEKAQSSRTAVSSSDMELMLREAVERYMLNCGLFGTPEDCVKTVEKFRAVGVDEVACLMDFGVATDAVIESFQYLNALRESCQPSARRLTATQPALTIPEEIARHNVTHMQCTPSLASGLALSPEALASLKSLKALLLGGEALPTSLAQQLRGTLTGDLINMYGPTETTVWSATHRVGEVQNTIPLGKPIANTQIYILDPQLQPVPIGVPGELFIGGEGVARGYLDRPELTAERFVSSPFASETSARLYRTGDLTRYRADSTLEFLGRLDHQVKLRGHRIELGEIESVLRAHSDVRDCVVDAREFAPGDQRLVAYLVSPRPSDALIVELRQALEAKLPGYMMPSDFVALPQLPLTPNGKVNRKALPTPSKARANSADAFVAPRTETEKRIAKLWQELLRIENVGLNDNFFDLGGHSLLVVQMQAKISENFGTQLPVVRLFQHPTVSALARCLGDAPKASSLKNIRDRGRRQREAFISEPEYQLAS